MKYYIFYSKTSLPPPDFLRLLFLDLEIRTKPSNSYLFSSFKLVRVSVRTIHAILFKLFCNKILNSFQCLFNEFIFK